MYSRIRCALEQAIDSLTEKDIVINVRWIGEEISIKSINDFALGYLDGVIAAVAASVFTALKDRRPSDKDSDEVRAIIRRRLPQIVGKIYRELNRVTQPSVGYKQRLGLFTVEIGLEKLILKAGVVGIWKTGALQNSMR